MVADEGLQHIRDLTGLRQIELWRIYKELVKLREVGVATTRPSRLT